MSNVDEVISEADRRAAVATEGEMSPDTAERLSVAQILDRGALPVLSQVGRPLICPTCGGASNYVQRMSMEGRACLHTTAGKSSKVLAWYCGEHERQNQVFDANLIKDRQQVDVEGWNLEVLDAVRGMAKHVVRDTMNATAIMGKAMDHIRALEAVIVEKDRTLKAIEATPAGRKLLAAVPAKKAKGHKWSDVKDRMERNGKLTKAKRRAIEKAVKRESTKKGKRR